MSGGIIFPLRGQFIPRLPDEIFGASLFLWYRGGDWVFSGSPSQVTTWTNKQGVTARDGLGAILGFDSGRTAVGPQPVTHEGQPAVFADEASQGAKIKMAPFGDPTPAGWGTPTEFEMFLVLKRQNPDGPWEFTGLEDGLLEITAHGGSSNREEYPRQDISSIQSNFGTSTALRTFSEGAVPFGSRHIYNIVSAPADWRAYFNGNNLLHSVGVNTPGVSAGDTTGPWLFASRGGRPFYGWMWEVIILSTLATTAQKNLLGQYFVGRYNTPWALF